MESNTRWQISTMQNWGYFWNHPTVTLVGTFRTLKMCQSILASGVSEQLPAVSLIDLPWKRTQEFFSYRYEKPISVLYFWWLTVMCHGDDLFGYVSLGSATLLCINSHVFPMIWEPFFATMYLNVYSLPMTSNPSLLNVTDVPSCDGIPHSLDPVLLPPCSFPCERHLWSLFWSSLLLLLLGLLLRVLGEVSIAIYHLISKIAIYF